MKCVFVEYGGCTHGESSESYAELAQASWVVA